MSKRLNKVTLALADEDLFAVDACRSLDPIFPPARAELIVVLLRDACSRLQRGESRLKDLYDLHGASPALRGVKGAGMQAARVLPGTRAVNFQTGNKRDYEQQS